MISNLLSSTIAILALVVWHPPTAMAFMPPASMPTSSLPNFLTEIHHHRFAISSSSSSTSLSSSFFADATESKKSSDATISTTTPSSSSSSSSPTNTEEVVDGTITAKQSATISPGDIVAISSSSVIKAYSVPKSCYGSFHSTSHKFIPAVDHDDNNNAIIKRSDSCLVLPIGLRGRVMQVYDAESLDRARPYVVKFEEGLDREEDIGGRNDGGMDGEEEKGGGFNLPKGFTMHFSAEEIELVASL